MENDLKHENSHMISDYRIPKSGIGEAGFSRPCRPRIDVTLHKNSVTFQLRPEYLERTLRIDQKNEMIFAASNF